MRDRQRRRESTSYKKELRKTEMAREKREQERNVGIMIVKYMCHTPQQLHL